MNNAVNNVISKIKMAAALATLAASMPGFAGNFGVETLECELLPMELYGFEQIDYNDYVCRNTNGDNADFVIFVDSGNDYRAGDILDLTLNIHGEVINFED